MFSWLQSVTTQMSPYTQEGKSRRAELLQCNSKGNQLDFVHHFFLSVATNIKGRMHMEF